MSLPARLLRHDFTPEPDGPVSLPVSVLTRGQRRFEAETYLTTGYGLRMQLETDLPFTRLREMADAWQPQRLKGILVSPKHGVPFLAATQVFDIRPAARKWVASSRTPHLEQRLVEPGWIMLTCSGTVGLPTIAYAPHTGLVISHDLVRVIVDDAVQRGYLYAFLRSRYGRAIMRSTQYGSVIKHLEPEHVQEVPVPDVPPDVRDQVAAKVSATFELREQAYVLLRQAERLYEDQFPPLPPTVDVGETYVTSLRALAGGRRRLDGSYRNPIAQMIESLIRTGDDVTLLDAMTARVFLPNRFKRVFVETGGVPFLGSEDIFKINPEITKSISPATPIDLDDYKVQRHWLLVARSGQTYGLNGSVMLADTWHERKVITEDIIRVVPDHDVRPGYLSMALGHPLLGRPLVMRHAFGSSIPHIDPTDLMSVPIPRLGETESQIADAVERASELRMAADNAEDDAVSDVETYLDEWLSDRQPRRS